MLTFDESEHSYFWNGTRVPNVTTILESVGIIDYSKIPSDTRDAALMRGRIVHLATQYDDEHYIGVSRQPLDEDSIADEHRGYVEAWRAFRANTGFRPELIEHRAFCAKWGYAGTLDRTGYFEATPTTHVLLDIKTGSADYWVRMQLAAYAQFFEHPRAFRRICAELHEDGTYRLYEFHGKDFQSDFSEFCYALAVWRTKSERRMGGLQRAA